MAQTVPNFMLVSGIAQSGQNLAPSRLANVVCATSKGSDRPVHTRRLIRAFASRLSILLLLSYRPNIFGISKLKRRLHRIV